MDLVTRILSRRFQHLLLFLFYLRQTKIQLKEIIIKTRCLAFTYLINEQKNQHRNEILLSGRINLFVTHEY